MIEWLTKEKIQRLKVEAFQTTKKRARISYHKPDDKITEMVIALHRTSYIRPHRHPVDKPESYHLIEGELEVRLFRQMGVPEPSVILTAERPFCRMQGGTMHQPVALTEWVVYHEVYPGPFDKARDVIYAKWSEEEDA